MEVVIIGICIAIVMIGIFGIGYAIYKVGYEVAQAKFEPDALRWRWHHEMYCADFEAHRRFLDAMGAVSQLERRHHG